MDEHTAGPWEAKLEPEYVAAQLWAEGRQVAEVYGETREARAANARLIATAPVLLKALQDIIAEFWTEYEYPDRAPEQSPTVKEIRKAEHVIREAKGELIPNVLSEFNRLCQRRDLAAYRAVATIQTVVLFWEAQDYDDVLAQLQKALADFKAADARISQFRNSYLRRTRPPWPHHLKSTVVGPGSGLLPNEGAHSRRAG